MIIYLKKDKQMKKIISRAILCLLPIYLSQVYANNDKEIRFPDRFENLLTAPSKRETIEIPIPKSYYESTLKQNTAFKEAIIKEETNESVVNVTLKTKYLNRLLTIPDYYKRYEYQYYFLDGYLTSIAIYIKYQSDGSAEEKKLIEDKFVEFLSKKGFFKSLSIMDNLNRFRVYRKENMIVKINNYENQFLIVISNKDLDENKKKIEEEVAQKKLQQTNNIINEILE